MLDSKNNSDALEISEALYRLMIRQLFYDGFQECAMKLADLSAINVVNCPPSNQLYLHYSSSLKTSSKTDENCVSKERLDLDADKVVGKESVTAPLISLYETKYMTAHKNACRTTCFSLDGGLIATGSEDASIKIIDVNKINARSYYNASGTQTQADQNPDSHPVIRTLYDHSDEVKCISFHPTNPFLISGSRDTTIKCFDYSKPALKKGIKCINECAPVESIAVHPGGEYLLVGCSSPTLRLYNLSTSACFTCYNANEQHSQAITDVAMCPVSAKFYASASMDGSIKLWDGRSMRSYLSIDSAHDHYTVTSICVSKNTHYLLSAGKDGSVVKLWELRMNRCLMAYRVPSAYLPTSGVDFNPKVSFNHNEDFILYLCPTKSLFSWQASTAEQKPPLSLTHQNFVRYFAHSPTDPFLVSCSDDCRARFWQRKHE